MYSSMARLLHSTDLTSKQVALPHGMAQSASVSALPPLTSNSRKVTHRPPGVSGGGLGGGGDGGGGDGGGGDGGGGDGGGGDGGGGDGGGGDGGGGDGGGGDGGGGEGGGGDGGGGDGPSRASRTIRTFSMNAGVPRAPDTSKLSLSTWVCSASAAAHASGVSPSMGT
jgi:hypothetical protein